MNCHNNSHNNCTNNNDCNNNKNKSVRVIRIRSLATTITPVTITK
jgi:hypothetical protein